MTKLIRNFNGCWFMFFNQAIFDMAKNHDENLPAIACQSMDMDINSYEIFWFNDVHFIKYNGWCRYLFDRACVNYFLVSEKVMRDPRVQA